MRPAHEGPRLQGKENLVAVNEVRRRRELGPWLGITSEDLEDLYIERPEAPIGNLKARRLNQGAVS